MTRVSIETLENLKRREGKPSENLKIARAKNLRLCKVTFKDSNPRLIQKIKIRKKGITITTIKNFGKLV